MTLLEILESLGIPYRQHGSHHHTSHGRVSVDCPKCSPGSGHYRLGIRLNGSGASCWSCGGVPLIASLMELGRVPYGKVKSLLEGLDSVREVRRKNVQGILKIPAGVGPMQTCHRRYLERRGFDPDELEATWGLLGTKMAGKLPWRIFLPITLDGVVVSWTTRSIAPNTELRYVSASATEESYPHRDLLYGEELVRHALVVCEGPTDAWAVGPGGVATMGLGYSRAQLVRMSRFPVRVVLFDSEVAAQQRARKLCRELQAFPGKTWRVELSGKDAASTSKEEILELRRRFLA